MKNKLSRSRKCMWLFSLLLGFTSFVVYPKLPAKIPTHWGIDGQINDYSSKSMIFFLAFLPFILMILFEIFPKIDPKKRSYELHCKAYQAAIFATIIFMAILYVITTAVALGYNLSVDLFIKIGIAVLFIIIGNVMGQVRHNYFFGIRTPWTLANEEVWRRTHRLASYGYVLSGLIAFISVFLKGALGFYIMITPIIISSIGLYLYSFIIYKKINNLEKSS